MSPRDKELEVKRSGDSVMAPRSLFQRGNGGSSPTSPLQFELREIKPQLAEELNGLWHSRLPRIHWSCITRNTHYVCYVAEYDYKWYAVAIWSSPVAQNRFKDGKRMLELRRLAISNDAPKNTATRMLAIMVKLIRKKFPDIVRLISYQDTEVHKGIIYKAAGWEKSAESKFITWSERNPTHNADQSKAAKIRWEYNI